MWISAVVQAIWILYTLSHYATKSFLCWMIRNRSWTTMSYVFSTNCLSPVPIPSFIHEIAQIFGCALHPTGLIQPIVKIAEPGARKKRKLDPNRSLHVQLEIRLD